MTGRRYRRMDDEPRARFFKTLNRLKQGHLLDNSFNEAERIVVALLPSPPSAMLTLHGPRDGSEMGQTWIKFKKRMNRARNRSRPFIYLGTRADGLGAGGEHLHLLLWDYLWKDSLARQTRELGLGSPCIRSVTSDPLDPIRPAWPIAYVLGQQQPIFGTEHHHRHKPRAKYQRRLLVPQRATLAEHQPELLSALEAAKSPSISDAELLSRVPFFISNTATD